MNTKLIWGLCSVYMLIDPEMALSSKRFVTQLQICKRPLLFKS
jgi:hypothetical protein